ncbi:MAG: hypothetical protein PSV35_01670, partial [bacterium]|nr:hypothetical protein [bacterium]
PYFIKYLNDMNLVFKKMTPIKDDINKSTNFINIQIQGQSNPCHIDLLGKTNIIVQMNANGTCVKK